MNRSTSILIRSGKVTLIYPISGRETCEEHLRHADEVLVRIESDDSIEDITYKLVEVSNKVTPRGEWELAEQDTVVGAPVGDLEPSDSDPNQRKVD